MRAGQRLAQTEAGDGRKSTGPRESISSDRLESSKPGFRIIGTG
jgi:hypothetical protein